jgi:hypothetical protein
MSTYVFDAAWQKERDRLAGLEDLFDESSFRHLTRLGATRGRLCLEVGGGAGGVAFWLSDIVGDTGHVLVTDLDTRFLDGHGRANVQVLVHNVVARYSTISVTWPSVWRTASSVPGG